MSAKTPSNFPGGSEGKASAYNVGDPGLILGWEDSLEKEMATHSSTLAWRIPWMEDPVRLQSMGSHRVGHDLESTVAANPSQGSFPVTSPSAIPLPPR